MAIAGVPAVAVFGPRPCRCRPVALGAAAATSVVAVVDADAIYARGWLGLPVLQAVASPRVAVCSNAVPVDVGVAVGGTPRIFQRVFVDP